MFDGSSSFVLKVSETPQESAEEIQSYARYKYPTMTKTQGNFRLKVSEGEFTDSQIIVMLGENGTGKTTFIRMLVLSSSITSSLLVKCWTLVNLYLLVMISAGGFVET